MTPEGQCCVSRLKSLAPRSHVLKIKLWLAVDSPLLETEIVVRLLQGKGRLRIVVHATRCEFRYSLGFNRMSRVVTRKGF